MSRIIEDLFGYLERYMPVFSKRIRDVLLRLPMRWTVYAILRSEKLTPRRLMVVSPYVLAPMTRTVEIFLGSEKIREYEQAARISRKIFEGYLERDLKALRSSFGGQLLAGSD